MTASMKTGTTGRAPGATPEPASFDEVIEARFARSDLTSEVVSVALWKSSCEGSIVEDDEAGTVITAWIPDELRGEALVALNSLEGVSAAIVRRPRIDWLAHYEQSLAPILIGTRFVVAPKAELAGETSRIAIVIPQEQAFGTGSHESTAMCLELMESLDLDGARCLDVGTGTGILAIGMARLGAAKVFAFDNDPEIVPVIALNLERNAVADGRIPVFVSSADALRGGPFEAVTMNILPHVIIELLPHVVPTIAARGALIVSGILLDQRHEVIARAGTSGLTLERELEQGEWWAGLLRKQA
jgi:ribosomal protein L11 methyltransferase